MLRSILDPDVRVLLPDGTSRRLLDFLIPSALMMAAALLLSISIFLPYWSFTMHAPQYPKGLRVDVFVTHLSGDVDETDALNHYLGMPPLNEGGQLERSISAIAIASMGLLLVGSVFIHNRWAAFLAVPAVAYPLIFLADLYLIATGTALIPTRHWGAPSSRSRRPCSASGRSVNLAPWRRRSPGSSWPLDRR